MRHRFIVRVPALVISKHAGFSLVHAQDNSATPNLASPKRKVVFQVSDNVPKKWECTMSKIRNIQAQLKDLMASMLNPASAVNR